VTVSKNVILIVLISLGVIGCQTMTVKTQSPSTGQHVNKTEEMNNKVFFESIKKGRTDKVKQLLDAGMSPDIKDQSGSTALQRAAETGNRDIVRLLLDRGSDVNARGEDGETALAEAVWNNDYGIYLDESSNNFISDCNISKNYDGINLWFSSNNTISSCNFLNNKKYGIYQYKSSNNTISNNTFINEGIVIYGDSLSHSGAARIDHKPPPNNPSLALIPDCKGNSSVKSSWGAISLILSDNAYS